MSSQYATREVKRLNTNFLYQDVDSEPSTEVLELIVVIASAYSTTSFYTSTSTTQSGYFSSNAELETELHKRFLPTEIEDSYKVGLASIGTTYGQAHVPGFTSSLFLSDMIRLLADLHSELIKQLEQTSDLIQNLELSRKAIKQHETLKSQILTGVSEGTLASILALNNMWQGGNITKSTELKTAGHFAATQTKTNFSSLADSFNQLVDLAKKLRDFIILNTQELQDNSVEKAEGEGGDDVIAKVAVASSAMPSASDESFPSDDDVGGDEAQTLSVNEEDLPPDPNQRGRTSNKLHASIVAFSHSYSSVIVNHLIAAYTHNDDLDAFSVDDLSQELRQTLSQQIQPKIKDIIYELTDRELAQLASGGEGSSQVRTKIFRQAQSFAINYPPIRLSIQLAINEYYTKLSGIDDKGSKAKQLDSSIEENTHLKIAENESVIQKVTTEEPPLSSEARALLQEVIDIKRGGYQSAFFDNLSKIPGFRGGEPEQVLIRANLDKLCANQVAANPLPFSLSLSEFEEGKIIALFGGALDTNTFRSNQDTIRDYLQFYWQSFRAERARIDPDFARLNELTTLTEGVNLPQKSGDLNAIVVDNFSGFTRGRDLTPEQTLHLASGKLDKNKVGIENYRASQRLIESLVQSTSSQQKVRYLKGVGIEWKQAEEMESSHSTRKSKLKHKDFLRILEQSNHQFSWVKFTIIETENTIAREVGGLLSDFDRVSDNQSTIATQNFLALSQALFGESFAKPSVAAQAPFFQNTQEALKGSGQLKQQLANQISGVAEKLTEMAVDAGMNYLTAGAWQGVPKPIRDIANKLIAQKVLQNVKRIGAALLGLTAATIALLKSGIAAATTLGGVGLGAAIGSVIPGVGTVAGGLIGGGVGLISGLLANSSFFKNRAATSAASSTPTKSRITSGVSRSARGGVENASAVTQDLSRNLRPSALLSGEGALFGVSSGAGASVVTATAVALPTILSLFNQQQITSSMLLTNPFTTQELHEMGISQYAQVKKVGKIMDHKNPNCMNQRVCEDPVFPIKVQYTITITPKNNYRIEINSVTDVTTVTHNKDRYTDANGVVTIPNVPKRTEEFLKRGEPKEILDATDGNPNNVSWVIEYEIEYDDQYNHALVRNQIIVEFDAFKGEEVEWGESVSSTTSISLGDAPDDFLCWPNTGTIKQEPFEEHGLTHKNMDAYDISPGIPGGLASLVAYAPYDGYATLYTHTDGYGKHLVITINYLGEEYVLYLAHLEQSFLDFETNKVAVPVSRGQEIGVVGNTGFSTGTHMHFENRPESTGSLSLTQLLTGSEVVVQNGNIVGSCAEPEKSDYH